MSEEMKNYSEAEQTAEFASDRTEVKENPPEDRTAEPSAEPSAEKPGDAGRREPRSLQRQRQWPQGQSMEN